jgi:AcrR family transcriptional regulator
MSDVTLHRCNANTSDSTRTGPGCQYGVTLSSVKSKRRKYEQRRRAENQAETRQRIVEAAVALHEALGPGKTTISAVAERAEVGRPTVYRHFPDELSLYRACSGHYLARHPPPDPESWRHLADPEVRLRTALAHTYAWYRATATMFAGVFRDLPDLPVLGEVMTPLLSRQDAIIANLVEAWPPAQLRLVRASVRHALALPTWQSLAVDDELSDPEIIELMTRLVAGAAEYSRTGSTAGPL